MKPPPSNPPDESAAELIPARPTLRTVREAAKNCHGCNLWKRGTQTVFGEGASSADLMLVGEQPGDQEDLAGHPFVGPAGRLLDRTDRFIDDLRTVARALEGNNRK